ncbi:MAG: hypothetical protein ACM37Z_19265, partial [Deltaproteobacteria bacterium]
MEQLIRGAFLVLFALEFGIEFFLNERNLEYVRARWREKKIPDFFQGKISSAVYERSVQYTIAKGHFQRWAHPYSRLVALFILFSGLLLFFERFSDQLAKWLWPLPYASGVIFCFTVGLVFSVASLPSDLYAPFGLEARFGFNKTSAKLYIADKLKGLLIGLLIGVPFLCVLFWLMEKTGHYWWIWVFVFVCGFQLL